MIDEEQKPQNGATSQDPLADLLRPEASVPQKATAPQDLAGLETELLAEEPETEAEPPDFLDNLEEPLIDVVSDEELAQIFDEAADEWLDADANRGFNDLPFDESSFNEDSSTEGSFNEGSFNEENETEPAEITEVPDETEPGDEEDVRVEAIDEEVPAVFGEDTVVDLANRAKATTPEHERQYIVFTLADSRYATPADCVCEVTELSNLTRIPNVPQWLLGVTNLRGDILSLVNLSAFLGLDKKRANGYNGRFRYQENQVLVVQSQHNASSITTGLVVDEISDTRYLDTTQISHLSTAIEDQIAPYLQGIYEEAGQMLRLIDLEKLLLSPEMWQFDRI